jgi:hypothetical protein
MKHGGKPRRATPIFPDGVAVAMGMLLSIALLIPCKTGAQQPVPESDPATTLTAALSAACRADQNQFANYLTADNATAFHALPGDRRKAFLKRFSLADGVGKPLLSSNANNPVLRCEAPEVTVEFRFGETRVRENLAFVPVSVTSGQETEFGLVRENGAWHLLSLGLVLLDVPQLSKEWSEQELASNESAAEEALRNIAGAVEIYRHAFDHMPASLAQMGPAPFNQISAEQAALIDEGLAAGAESGYQFRYRVVAAATGVAGGDTKFEVTATPDTYGKTGRRSFLLDTGGTVRAADHGGGAATADDPAVENEKSPGETHP